MTPLLLTSWTTEIAIADDLGDDLSDDLVVIYVIDNREGNSRDIDGGILDFAIFPCALIARAWLLSLLLLRPCWLILL